MTAHPTARSSRRPGRRLALALAALGVIATSLAPVAPAAAVAVCPTFTAGIVSPAPAPGIDWTGCNLTGFDLHGADLTGALLTRTTLTSADLHGAILAGASLNVAIASLTNFQGADLHGADLTQAQLRSSLLGHADLTGAVLDRANVTSSNFDAATLTSITAPSSTWSNTSMIGTTLTGAGLGTAVLTGVRGSALVVGAPPPTFPAGYGIRNGLLVGPAANLPGADLHGQDLTGLSLARAHVTAANLAGANLAGVSLSFAVLTAVDLSGADLTGANLATVHSTGITGTPLLPAGWSVTQGCLVGPGADLTDARFTGVDLSGRDLTATIWSRAELVGADLTGANLTGAILNDAVVTDASVTGATIDPANVLLLRTANLTGTPAFLAPRFRLVRGVLLGPSVRVEAGDFAHASLRGIDLTGAFLNGGAWDGVDLTGAKLTSARLQFVYLSGALVGGVDFTNGMLGGVGFDGADLRGANFTSALLASISFANADLLGTTGLGTGQTNDLYYNATRCPDGTMSERHIATDCLAALDVVAPTVTLGRWAPYQMSGGNQLIPLGVRTSDPGGGSVVSMQVRERWTLAGRANWSAWSDPVYQDPGGPSFLAGGISGELMCEQARAVDVAGNWSAWSAQTCSTWMTDDLDLLWSSQWRRHDRARWYNSTYASTSAQGASMRSTSSRTVRRLGLAALGCPTCGSVALYVGATRIRTVSLARPTSGRIVLTFPAFAARTGTVKLVVTSRGKPVIVDGVLISAT